MKGNGTVDTAGRRFKVNEKGQMWEGIYKTLFTPEQERRQHLPVAEWVYGTWNEVNEPYYPGQTDSRRLVFGESQLHVRIYAGHVTAHVERNPDIDPLGHVAQRSLSYEDGGALYHYLRDVLKPVATVKAAPTADGAREAYSC